MTQQVYPTAAALLLRQIGEALYGASWQVELSGQISVSDRSMRRWASGEDDIPPGVWRDIHFAAQSKWLTIRYFDEEIEKMLNETSLEPIPNTAPEFDLWGLYFSLRTNAGRPLRCFIRREVLNDRTPTWTAKTVIDYFRANADVFYRVAQRKFEAGDLQPGLISIDNYDVEFEGLPNIRENA
jgi:hypothetical protein